MSQFTTPADLRMLDCYQWELLAPFEYHLGTYPSSVVLQVPQGTVTDLASIPRVLWTVFPPHGRWAKAAILHDYLYQTATMSRYKADCVFREALQVLGVSKPVCILMYCAVRVFGRAYYGKNSNRIKK